MPEDITRTLRAALSRLESDRARIDRQISALRTALGGATDGRAPASRRRRMSPEARRAVSQRMKAYWATRRAKAGSKSGRGKKAEKPAAKSEK